MADLKNIEDSHKEPESINMMKTTTEMIDFLNNVEDKLSSYLGCKGVPLSYLIRTYIKMKE